MKFDINTSGLLLEHSDTQGFFPDIRASLEFYTWKSSALCFDLESHTKVIIFLRETLID